jgi:dTMP kinase
MPAFVVSIDGTDFSGKTTIANIVTELLRQKNKKFDVRRTNVPSDFVTGTFTNILRSCVDHVSSEVFALVYAADHLFHYNHSIKPLQDSGRKYVVIQERSLLSTFIYQGLLGNVDFPWLKEINKYDKNIPQLTIIIKIPVEELLKRKSLDRRMFDKFEEEGHIKKQTQLFYNLPKELAEEFNVKYVDGNADATTVAKMCVDLIQKEIEKF